jgi:hypothetical protein
MVYIRGSQPYGTYGNAGVPPHATGARNPRENTIVEHLHQTIGNSLRTRLREHPPTNLETA